MDSRDFRAKQFLPFDALKGFYDAIGEKHMIKMNKKNLSEDIFEELNLKINDIKKEDKVTIKYFYNFDYIETSGIIKKIDRVNKKIYIMNSVIDICDIIDIEKNYK